MAFGYPTIVHQGRGSLISSFGGDAHVIPGFHPNRNLKRNPNFKMTAASATAPASRQLIDDCPGIA
jgi:hypothetical protein